MPSYRITLSFDIDNVPTGEQAQDVADTIEVEFSKAFEAFVTGDGNDDLFGRRVSNVQAQRPDIITNV